MARMFALIILLFLISGCADVALFSGPGTALEVGSTDKRSDQQRAYFRFLCSQVYIGDNQCISPSPEQLSRLVYVALNDIDDRCESYVSSLRQAKLEGDSYISQLARTGTSSAYILGQTFDKTSKSGARTIAIVQAAFGLSQVGLKDYYSRLLLAIPPTDVQQLILKRQTAFRITLRDGLKNGDGAVIGKMPLASQADAYYIVRSYLQICTPASIEASVSESLDDYVAIAPIKQPIPVIHSVEGGGGSKPVTTPQRVDPDVGALVVRKPNT